MENENTQEDEEQGSLNTLQTDIMEMITAL